MKVSQPTSKQGICIQCDKALSVSHLRCYTAETNSGICRTCVAKNNRAPKTCAKCARPLHANATPGTWCNVCAYPPCSAGCGQPRPKKATYHAKLVGQELWTCGACAQKPCVQCGKDVDATAKAHLLGVSIVHIPRVRVAVPHGRAQPATMSRSSRSGRVKTALSNHVHSAGRRWSRKRKPIPCVQRAVIHRVRLVVAHGHAKVVTMSKICLRGHVQPV